jgi:acyl-CoA synthetase (NDP forming)
MWNRKEKLMSMKLFAANLCKNAAAEGRDTLLEPELYSLLAEGGVPVPAFYNVKPDAASIAAIPDVSPIPGAKVVVKVVSPAITHKTEMGGVRIVENNKAAIAAACQGIIDTVTERGGAQLAATIRSLMVSEKVSVGTDLSSQLFAGMRFSPDVGPVLAFGFGGLEAEELAVRFNKGEGVVLVSPLLNTSEEMLAKFKKSFVYRKLSGQTRGGDRQIEDVELLKAFEFFRKLATEFSNTPDSGWLVQDFEINPFFVSNGRLVAVDAFMRFSAQLVAERVCDLDKIDVLLNPKTIAIVGASPNGINVGRVILGNLRRDKFPVENVRAVRPDCVPVDGIPSVASIADLPWRADLVVVAVGAKMVPQIIRQAIDGGNVASMLLISGGMGETQDGKETDREIRALIKEARAAGRFVPVFVGPNCLGVRSAPGHYDTLFIPETKLPLPDTSHDFDHVEVSLICQSGGFLITRMINLPYVAPRYAISTGNQMDLALVDYVESNLREGKVEVFGLYIEGFSPLDGLRLAKMISKARKLGKDFVIYKAGRTTEGVTATSSHTASISGDYQSCYQVLSDAGALMTETLEEFSQLLTMAIAFKHKKVGGNRLACLGNAGYETVGMADAVCDKPKFELGRYDEATTVAIQNILNQAQLGSLVDMHNPLDITPMAPDAVYAAVLQAQAACPEIDACVVGILPLTTQMKTLPHGVDPRGFDDIMAPDALPALLPQIVHNSNKPIITTQDCGKLYDPLSDELRKNGVLCFKSVDSAMKSLQRYMAYRLGLD